MAIIVANPTQRFRFNVCLNPRKFLALENVSYILSKDMESVMEFLVKVLSCGFNLHHTCPLKDPSNLKPWTAELQEAQAETQMDDLHGLYGGSASPKLIMLF